MFRRIIKIDEEKCSGCGLCVRACHEGAIGLVNGKARLMREDYCDGLGDCLPACPENAISFEEREAPAYNEAAVLAAKKSSGQSGCPGAALRAITREASSVEREAAPVSPVSRLRQWPVQIKLVPVNAPFFNGADLLIAADCTAYAYGSFHADFIRGRVTVIGCPKLDNTEYAEKLTAILEQNEVRSVMLTRMEVPCCGGLEYAARQAIAASGKTIPLRVVTISADGEILEQAEE